MMTAILLTGRAGNPARSTELPPSQADRSAWLREQINAEHAEPWRLSGNRLLWISDQENEPGYNVAATTVARLNLVCDLRETVSGPAVITGADPAGGSPVGLTAEQAETTLRELLPALR
ncbi:MULTISPECIES: hypothetical protein [unclassified Streptomyces]|uniref:hypothetical protein n=1 Tax=unclassified Streptomyces TaxID=2593676 RepID=UPI002DD7F459|nr:hypothetical protein [Streptomyces sp. NBC_01795]WSA97780.1 hypothetical protein OIE63_40550 [Streptomyces sp. NBC_01795]WSS46703.1 hypothetical protein OG220_39670 [Streptomyces sp. NBC_01187]WSS47080.1 hypothetical protein OG220_41955 [Streptomyces sp. NBC_01187]